nr:hypothetical protein [uncultured Acinetobacter sp.]
MKSWSKTKICIAAVGIILLILLIYFSGSFYEQYKSSIKEDEAFMRITIMVISSLVTVLAMIVALFKEDIRGLFIKPKLDLSKDNKLNEVTQRLGQNNVEAMNYHYTTYVQNTGNIPAKEVEVYLTSLKHKKNNEQSYKDIEIDSIPLTWKNSESKQIMIPRNSRKSLILFQVLPPSNVSTPDQPPPNASNQSQIQIGTNKYSVDVETGEWDVVFSIYADNAKPINIHLTINWNGTWESRLTEMNTHLSVKEEIKHV